MTMKAETGVTQPQAREHQRLQAASRSWERYDTDRFSRRGSRRNEPRRHLHFRFPASGTRRMNSRCPKPPGWRRFVPATTKTQHAPFPLRSALFLPRSQSFPLGRGSRRTWPETHTRGSGAAAKGPRMRSWASRRRGREFPIPEGGRPESVLRSWATAEALA